MPPGEVSAVSKKKPFNNPFSGVKLPTAPKIGDQAGGGGGGGVSDGVAPG